MELRLCFHRIFCLGELSTATKKVAATVDLVASTSYENIAATPNGEYIYVINDGGGVSVISTATNEVTATIPIDTNSWRPDSLAISPNGAYVYVTDALTNLISVISVATNTVIAVIPVGLSHPAFVAVSPNGEYLYVTNSTENVVIVFDTTTDTVTATVPVGSYPECLAVTPDGEYIYVGNQNDSTISVVNTTAPAPTKTPAPTLPEFSWLVILPLLASMPFIALKAWRRKTANASQQTASKSRT